MLTILALLGVVALLFLAAALATVDRPALADAPPDAADLDLPQGPVRPGDVQRVRFSLAPRGYRMSEVDLVLERLAAELADRDRRLDLLEAGLEGGVQPTPDRPAAAPPVDVHEATEADLPVASAAPAPAPAPAPVTPADTRPDRDEAPGATADKNPFAAPTPSGPTAVPVATAVPVEPATPAVPFEPVAPVAPVAGIVPAAPAVPVEPVEGIAPVESAEPVEPVESGPAPAHLEADQGRAAAEAEADRGRPPHTPTFSTPAYGTPTSPDR